MDLMPIMLFLQMKSINQCKCTSTYGNQFITHYIGGLQEQKPVELGIFNHVICDQPHDKDAQ
jgi:hypothetical protein